MKRLPQVFLLCGIVVTASLPLRAQQGTAVSPDTAASNPILAPKPTAETSAQARAVAMSPVMAARLAVLAPKYDPAAATRKDQASSAGTEEEKPRNGIVRLPRYVVTMPKMRPISEAQMLTPAGKLDLAMKVFPGLKLGIFSLGNEGLAMAMIEDELARGRAKQAADLMSLLPANDSSVDGEKHGLIQEVLTPHSFTRDVDLSSHPPGR